MFIAGVITFITCYFVASLMEIQLLDTISKSPKYTYEIIKIFVIGTLCLAIYTGLNIAMKMEYANELITRITERLKK